MRKSNTQPLSEVIGEYIEALKMKSRLDEARVLNAWEEVLGKTLSSHTGKMYIRNRTLFVQVNSAVVRNELMMQRMRIIQELNKKAGKPVIENLVLR